MLMLLLTWLVSAISLLIVAYLLPGFHVDGFKSALIAALVIGLVNGTLGIVLKLLTLPLTILTLGFFWLVINALMLMLVSSLLSGFKVDGFWWALIGSVLLSIVNGILKSIVER
jgi:putative membrane protein